MHALKTALAAAVLCLAPASAGVITFGTASMGAMSSKAVYEDGYAYMRTDGALNISYRGEPGHALEAAPYTWGGSVTIFRPDGGTFLFDSIDFAAYETGCQQDQFLSLVGRTTDGTLFQEYYTLNTTSSRNPTYSNWTTELPTAAGLEGKELEALSIVLFSYPGFVPTYGAVDNVVLTEVSHDPVPEPATLSLLAAGLIGFAWRRRKAAKA